MSEATLLLTDTVQVMPTDIKRYLPLAGKSFAP
jgi:hypothetical protein